MKGVGRQAAGHKQNSEQFSCKPSIFWTITIVHTLYTQKEMGLSKVDVSTCWMKLEVSGQQATAHKFK
jgi:hypothetical protein